MALVKAILRISPVHGTGIDAVYPRVSAKLLHPKLTVELTPETLRRRWFARIR